MKNYKIAVIPLTLGIIFPIANINMAISVPVSVGLSILGARILYNKGWIKGG